MWGKSKSAVSIGVNSYLIEIQADIASGLPQLSIVGLPDTSVKEARERVRSAIRNSGFTFPPDKITVNLAPADIKKEGPAYDLPIALSILSAAEVIPPETLNRFLILGELGLNGDIRPVGSAFIIAAEYAGKLPMLLPEDNAKEGALLPDAEIYPAKNLAETVQFLRGEILLAPTPLPSIQTQASVSANYSDFSEVRGQSYAKRAIEIAAAGGHNLLMIGPPGSGKTMLAQRIPGILPPLDYSETIEVMKIQSYGNPLTPPAPGQHRPFRAPHHTISAAALAGGGTIPKPGEISLAHAGVLFLDELPEFKRDTLECLRGPLEDGDILISRAKQQVRLPAKFMFIAAMNPCPCGWLGSQKKICRCTLQQIQKYQQKISGPILDRIDIHIEVPPLSSHHLITSELKEEPSAAIRERIITARALQRNRFGSARTNSHMGAKEIKRYAKPDSDGLKLLEMALKEIRLSARAYFKILKIARTIADLAGCETIRVEHIAEAVQYRSLDRH